MLVIKQFSKWLLLGAVFAWVTVAAASGPVAMMTDAVGLVEYAKDGKPWKAIKQSKVLFEGYQIRSGADGGGKLVNQASGQSQSLGANSVIEVLADGFKLISGSLAAPQASGGTLVANLGNRFQSAQKYTTVRRGVKKDEIRLATATASKNTPFLLAKDWSELVWESVGPEYGYVLELDGKRHSVPAAKGEWVRFSVENLTAGEHAYKVHVLDQAGNVVFEAKKPSSFVWLGEDERKALGENLPKDALLAALYLEGAGVMVGAMDMYRDYFSRNQDDNDMRPMLIQLYHNLKLTNLKQAEANTYNAMLQKE